jgi:hypothetical protein
VNRNQFAVAVRSYNGDRYVKGFPTWDHFVSMLFCHLAQAKSLREISAGLRSSLGKLSHMGVRKAPIHSTLADANEHRDWRIYQRIFFDVLALARSGWDGKRKVRIKSKLYSIDAELGENASGVLYALGGASGGLALYMDKGELVYEYNMMVIERYKARSQEKLAAGRHRIEVNTTIAKPGAPADVIIKADGKEMARTTVKRTVPAALTASESFDVGVDLGSRVSLDYFDRRPFKFNGKIEQVRVELR